MITVTITKNASNEYVGVQSIGHAGFARLGKDIVCAAVSTLFINTLNSIESLTDDKDFMNVISNEKAGLIDCRFTSAISERSQLLLDAMVLGLQDIENQPLNKGKKYLKLIFEEV